ncbi:unnamed protein product [Leptosia nina]|uniref:Secreted protein n=1 Tax=Leptosia nina TaxID=320188 RepID=A0AAV1JPN1_9NEOP
MHKKQAHYLCIRCTFIWRIVVVHRMTTLTPEMFGLQQEANVVMAHGHADMHELMFAWHAPQLCARRKCVSSHGHSHSPCNNNKKSLLFKNLSTSSTTTIVT